ncbi:glycosyltransferase [Natrinema sp. CBA1119]|uniref:glycosyltransferase n=1 Tax=Natrinema sp. CBA1119 TaxID=1608465 RepID=UPI00159BE7B5|nr:glycosyltransferase [Natrinema sp. CBA1119]
MKRIAGNSLTIKGQQPFDEIPKWIAAVDAIAIPQRNTLATRGQLPAKVFDAMAMAKPIIATNVSDLPTILDGCGLIVEPEEPTQLQDAILRLFFDETLREEIGQAARKRCVKQYSYDALAPVIDEIVTTVADD